MHAHTYTQSHYFNPNSSPCFQKMLRSLILGVLAEEIKIILQCFFLYVSSTVVIYKESHCKYVWETFLFNIILLKHDLHPVRYKEADISINFDKNVHPCNPYSFQNTENFRHLREFLVPSTVPAHPPPPPSPGANHCSPHSPKIIFSVLKLHINDYIQCVVFCIFSFPPRVMLLRFSYLVCVGSLLLLSAEYLSAVGL